MPFLLLMPSYNQARFIGEAITSCINQDDPDWELWILDNSTDGTPEVVRGFQDARIHYEHRPERTSPGACLNELLRTARGDHFSYVHTDNNLAPSFVRDMRRGLGAHASALAYCDVRFITETGHPTGLWRRPEYGLSDILGTATLGAPFAATTALARELGGFSAEDLADDTFFCAKAYGRGPWTRVPKPLVDYRFHSSSRTEQSGIGSVERSVLKGHEIALKDLEERGFRPLEAMAQRIVDHLDGLESAIEDAWLKALGHSLPAPPRELTEHAFATGLFRLEHFGPRDGGPARPPIVTRLRSTPARRALRVVREEFRHRFAEFRSVLAGWAWLSAGPSAAAATKLQVRSLDYATLWCAKLIAASLGWQPVLSPTAGAIPSWLTWPVEESTEVWIDLRNRPFAMIGVGA